METPREPLFWIAVLVTALVLAAAPPLQADAVRIENPGTPIEPPITLQPEELWRLGGESETPEGLFGVIASVDVDEAGNVYLLDRQLSEVKVFSLDGKYLRTIGREGEGPGEFRRPTGMFLTADGKLAVLQPRPGKIVLLTPEGEPAGELPLPRREGGGRLRLVAGRRAGETVVLQTMAMTMQPPKAVRTVRLSCIDSGGREVALLYEHRGELNLAAPEFDERTSIPISWTVGPRNRIYAVTEYGRYAIHVWRPDGTEERIIGREYVSRKRTRQEMEEMKGRFVIRGARNPKVVVSEHDPDVFRIHPRADSTLWVLTSRGAKEAPEGTLGIFDVFDAGGRFLRQVTLSGEGDPNEDAYYFLGDRLYVVTQYLSAVASMFGGGHGEETPEDTGIDLEPMEVICYALDAD